jgi:hypothetical protein
MLNVGSLLQFSGEKSFEPKFNITIDNNIVVNLTVNEEFLILKKNDYILIAGSPKAKVFGIEYLVLIVTRNTESWSVCVKKSYCENLVKYGKLCLISS